MRATEQEMNAAAGWAKRLLSGDIAAAPFSVRIGDADRLADAADWQFSRGMDEETHGVRRQTVTFIDPATGLSLEVEVCSYLELPAVEWLLRLRNDGSEHSPMLEEILPLDALVALDASRPCTVHHAKGALCSPDDFAPLRREMRPGGVLQLTPGGGRSSSEFLPFLNVDLGDDGLALAVGWTGEWLARLTRTGDGLRLQAGMETTRLRLLPGEEIRTPLILVVCWEQDRYRGHNLLRRSILCRHRPGIGLSEPQAAAPLCCGNWGGTNASVHLSNIGHIVEKALPFEYYWIDAEWFGKPGHWMESAGHWTPRPDLYPEGLRPISDALHAAGRKLLLWFEPERVAPGTPWDEELDQWLLSVPDRDAVKWADYGDWMSPEEWVQWESARNQLGAGDRLLNLGHPDARRFLTDFLSDRIDEFGVDCLRWDSNIAQLAYWRGADAPDRQGITEIRYIEGQYAVWDELLARHPGLIIDNCASGGRRIDIESLTRSTPLWRSDYTVGHSDAASIQCHTWGLLHWVPLNGTGGLTLSRCDRYQMRSTMCSSWVAGLHGGGDLAQAPLPADYDFDHARGLLEEYLSVREYFQGDFYPLTEYSRTTDAWMGYQLDRPECGDGILVVLRRDASPYTTARLTPRALDPALRYEFVDADRGTRREAFGEAWLADGYEVSLPQAPLSALIRYRVVGG